MGKLDETISLLGWYNHNIISSVLGALPTYTMSLFSAPSSVLKHMDKLTRDFFLRQANELTKPICLVSWKTVTKDNRKGNLGIKNVILKAISGIGDLTWRVMHFGGEFYWKSSLDNPWHAKESIMPHGIGVWEQIRGLWNKFETNMGFTLVNGRKIRLTYPTKRSFLGFLLSINMSQWDNCRILYITGWTLSLRRDIYDWKMERIGLFQMLSNIVLDDNKRDSIS